jgi:hypothetical protein
MDILSTIILVAACLLGILLLTAIAERRRASGNAPESAWDITTPWLSYKTAKKIPGLSLLAELLGTDIGKKKTPTETESKRK